MWVNEVKEVDRIQVIIWMEVMKTKWEELALTWESSGQNLDPGSCVLPSLSEHGNAILSESWVFHLQKVDRKPSLTPSWGW